MEDKGFVLFSITSPFGFCFPWEGLLYRNDLDQYAARRWVVQGVRPVAQWAAKYRRATQYVEVVAVRADKAAELEEWFSHPDVRLYRASPAELRAVVCAHKEGAGEYSWTTRRGTQQARRLNVNFLAPALLEGYPSKLGAFLPQNKKKFVPLAASCYPALNGLWDPSTGEPV